MFQVFALCQTRGESLKHQLCNSLWWPVLLDTRHGHANFVIGIIGLISIYVLNLFFFSMLRWILIPLGFVVFGSMLNNLLKVVPILVIRDGSKYYPITQISFNDSNQTVLKGKEETLH